MSLDSLGDRMKKNYEDKFRSELPFRLPAILRIDGKAFHSYTKNFEKPWDSRIRDAFSQICFSLLKEISGSKICYCQSDEISVLITDYDNLGTNPWFGKNIQKMVSVAASIAAAQFNNYMNHYVGTSVGIAYFDARTFVLPKEEVNNYFLWRQNDATRNSVMGLAQKHFSHKELHGVNNSQAQEILWNKKNINWNNEDIWKKRGWCVVKKTVEKENQIRTEMKVDLEIPVFSQDKNYIEQFVYLEEK